MRSPLLPSREWISITDLWLAAGHALRAVKWFFKIQLSNFLSFSFSINKTRLSFLKMYCVYVLIYTIIPVDWRRRPTTSKEWCHHLTVSLRSHASLVAWLDDSTRVVNNFQADRWNKEPGQSRGCTKWDGRDGLTKHCAWTVLAGIIHTGTTEAGNEQYCLDCICLHCRPCKRDQRQTTAFDITVNKWIPKHRKTNLNSNV